jgi:hypothetical protein
MSMDKIIRTIRRYTGRPHVGLRNERVVILSVHRADTILKSNDAVSGLRSGDVVEFALLSRGPTVASGCRGSRRVGSRATLGRSMGDTRDPARRGSW